MSDIQSISPLLDGFRLGDSISSHDGIVCCPAIQEGTDEKYIVKILSVPASQKQLDAFLLAGAYKDPADAMGYFQQQGEEIMREAQILQSLTALEGFAGYDGWQMEPIPKHRLGFLVYLVGKYRLPLDKYLRQHPVTHLEAMNLGLDLCAALSVCRQAGSLYVNLKPTNVYVSDKKEYLIGDLGFLSLDSLSYTVIPERYHSAYTPPELLDPMAPMNLTADTYAVGMILYQLYNDGQLPFRGKAPEGELPSPVSADYELAEIIMRAIHPDPECRWEDPKELGQALVSYMQRNTIKDSPISITSPIVNEPESPISTEISPDPTAADDPGSVLDSSDESAPSEEDADRLLPHEMSDELSRIVAKADDLIAMEPPPSVVLPDIPEQEDPFAFASQDLDEPDDSDVPYDPVMQDPKEPPVKDKKENKFVSPEEKRRKKRIRSRITALLILAAILFCGYWYYQLIYLQDVRAITLETGVRELSVQVDSDIPDSKLQVVCQDNVGNSFTQPLYHGYALFTGLQPNTTYQIFLEIDGFHHLTGHTSSMISTDTTTQILAFSATAGMEDGSVILEFIPDGEEPSEWTLMTSADGQDSQLSTFTGHSYTVSGLEVGKIYSFTLGTGNGLSLSGKTTLDYMAPRLILAQNIALSSQDGSSLKVSWQAPGDIILDSWLIRCYNNAGYDQKLTVTDSEAQFVGIDFTTPYMVEITAAGMSLPQQLSIPANPFTVTDFRILDPEDIASDCITFGWDSGEQLPDGGWLVSCSIDGIQVVESVICEGNSVAVSPRIPGGKYRIQITTASGETILNSSQTILCPEAENLDFNGLTADMLEGFLLKTPSETNWRYDSVTASQEFAPSSSISVVLHATGEFYRPGAAAEILYVIRDSQGNALPYLCDRVSGYWHNIWSSRDYHYGQLTLPTSPAIRGSYSVCIYINGQFAIELPFTIS